MSPSMLIAVLAFVAIAGLGFAFMAPGQSARAQKRTKAIASGGGARPGDRRKQAAEQAASKRRQSTQEALKELGLSEKRQRQARVSVKGQIAQAGLSITPTTYWVIAGCVGAALAVAGFFVQGAIGAGAGLFVGVLGLPRWFLGMMVTSRQKKFTNQLADAIDVIVRGVKSGLPLSQCLRIIAQESPEPLRSEFQHIVDAQAMGVPPDQTMQRLYDRMPLPEVNFFAIVLVIQQKTGGNLSESLGNLSAVLRSRKLMREKVKALSAEAKASAMIIGALPFIVMVMVYIIRPEYISVLFVHPTGHLILLGAATMMTMGILIMRNMINFKF